MEGALFFLVGNVNETLYWVRKKFKAFLSSFWGRLYLYVNYISRTNFFNMSHLTELEWDLILIPKTLLYIAYP